jgi:hypothetical protein
MSQPITTPLRRVPTWLLWLGSLAIVFHLGSVGVNALAAPSGPWPGGEGDQIVRPPLIFFNSDRVVADYLQPIRMTTNYHLLANQMPGKPGVWLEFRLKDDDGKELATVKLPDANANAWVRHRQSILTTVFGEDQRIAPPQSEIIAAPGREVPKVQFWDMDKGLLKLKTVDINQIPRDHPVSGPNDFTFLCARSYARYLCRTHGAAKVEIIRHHQDPIRPFVVTEESVPARQFDEVISIFGEFSK